jgi:hypothetical protein
MKEEKPQQAEDENGAIIDVVRPSCHHELCVPVAARLFAQLPPPSRVIYVTSRGLPRDDFIVLLSCARPKMERV